MTLQPVFSIFPCSSLPSWTCRTLGLSIPWCCLPSFSSVCLVFFPFSLCLGRWFWPDLMNGRHDHTTFCVSLRWHATEKHREKEQMAVCCQTEICVNRANLIWLLRTEAVMGGLYDTNFTMGDANILQCCHVFPFMFLLLLFFLLFLRHNFGMVEFQRHWLLDPASSCILSIVSTPNEELCTCPCQWLLLQNQVYNLADWRS